MNKDSEVIKDMLLVAIRFADNMPDRESAILSIRTWLYSISPFERSRVLGLYRSMKRNHPEHKSELLEEVINSKLDEIL